MISQLKNLLKRVDPNSLEPSYQKILVAIELCGGEAYLKDIASITCEKKREYNTKKKLDWLFQEGCVKVEENGREDVYQLNLENWKKDLEENKRLHYRNEILEGPKSQ